MSNQTNSANSLSNAGNIMGSQNPSKGGGGLQEFQFSNNMSEQQQIHSGNAGASKVYSNQQTSIFSQADSNQLNLNYKLPQGQPIQQQNSSDSSQAFGSSGRPQSRGNLNSNRLIQNQQNSAQEYIIPGQNSQGQPFQFTGGPNINGQGSQINSHNGPQIHFIANYRGNILIENNNQNNQQINNVHDKRPYTASSVNQSTNKRSSKVPQTGSNQKNGGGSSSGAPSQGGSQGGNQNTLATALYLGSKTHGVGFNLGNLMNQGGGGVKYGSNGGAGYEGQSQNQFSSIFNGLSSQQFVVPPVNAVLGQSGVNFQQQMNSQQSELRHKLQKIKPNKGALKEKEHLYEEAIKLKIQANTFREENVKLKTKIKILENEMSKKEKALEDFFAQNLQLQQNQKQSNSNPNLAPLAQTAQKIQSETYLVMCLKKQVKELKFDLGKREEELDLLKKNIKGTKIQEIEVEIKAYKDECQRLRVLLEDILKSGPDHPLYKQSQNSKVQELEEQLREKEGQVMRLQREKEELNQIIQERNEIMSKKEEKNKGVDEKQKKELNKELSKAKKTVREKEKEIVKLRTEISAFRKVDSNTNNGVNGGSSTMAGQGPGVAIGITGKSESNKEQQDLNQQLKNLQGQVSSYQKKTKDCLNDLKVKKEKIEEQDVIIKKLQERLQNKIDELNNEQKKSKLVKDELEKVRKGQQGELTQQDINKLEKECANVIEVLRLVGKKQKLGAELLAYKIKKEGGLNTYLDYESEQMRSLVSKVTEVQLYQILKSYKVYSNGEEQIIWSEIEGKLRNKLSSFEEKGVSQEQFKQIIENEQIQLEKEQLEYLLYQFLQYDQQFKIFVNLEGLVKELNTSNQSSSKGIQQSFERISSAKSDQRSRRPQTAKSQKKGEEEQQQQKSMDDNLKKIEEKEEDDNDEDEYEEDKGEEEENYEEDFQSNQVKENQEEKKLEEEDQQYKSDKFEDEQQMNKDDKEPSKPQINQSTTSNKEGKEEEKKQQKKKKKKGTSAASKSIDNGIKEDELTKNQEIDGRGEGHEGGVMDEEEMLDVAEHCFIRIAELMIEKNRSVRGIFTKYSIPEQFPDGTILELMSPIAFLEGVKELGLDDLSEMEAACLLRVLTKPELESAIILNELILIMENFGVVDNYDEEEDDEDDYIPDEEEEEGEGKKEEEKIKEGENKEKEEKKERNEPKSEGKAPKRKIQLNFDDLEEKGLKILRKLARFLLERYMHPREFFGPAIYKQLVKTKKRENNVEIMQTKDFYLRLKLAGLRKTIKEIENLNKFLCLDTKYTNLLHVKKVVKALEEVAQGEQLKLQEEMQLRMQLEEEQEETSIKKELERIEEQKNGESKKKDNQDLLGEHGIEGDPSQYTGGPDMLGGYQGYLGGMQDFYANHSKVGAGGISKYTMLAGGSSMMPTSLSSGKMMYLNHFNHLNTIEEEKHETQTSNYFKEGESEREDSKYLLQNQSNQIKGSRILQDLHQELEGEGLNSSKNINKVEGNEKDNQSNTNKSSAQISRREQEYNFNQKDHGGNSDNKKKMNEQENEDEEQEEEEDEENYEEDEEQHQKKEDEDDDEYQYEEEEQDDEEKKDSDKNQVINSEQEEVEPRIETERDNKSIDDMESVDSNKHKEEDNEADEVEEEEDYEI